MKVAVCVDDSKPSQFALENAVEFAKQSDAELIVIHSVNPEVTYTDEDELVKEADEDAVARGRDMVHTLVDKIQQDMDESVDVSAEVLTTDNGPVSAIIDYLEEDDVTQVFIGHRALDKKHEQLFGSFAKELISESPVPVTVTTTNGSVE